MVVRHEGGTRNRTRRTLPKPDETRGPASRPRRKNRLRGGRPEKRTGAAVAIRSNTPQAERLDAKDASQPEAESRTNRIQAVGRQHSREMTATWRQCAGRFLLSDVRRGIPRGVDGKRLEDRRAKGLAQGGYSPIVIWRSSCEPLGRRGDSRSARDAGSVRFHAR